MRDKLFYSSCCLMIKLEPFDFFWEKKKNKGHLHRIVLQIKKQLVYIEFT